MMEKGLRVLAMVVVVLVIAACAGSGEDGVRIPSVSSSNASVALPQLPNTQTPSSDVQAGGEDAPSRGEIDVDLTALSSTMRFAEVYNMMMNAGDYVGKTVKMEGVLDVYHDETLNSTVCSVLITDATECCEEGILFVFDDSYAYPEDYPTAGETVTVVGTFDIFTEADSPIRYSYLTNATLA